MRFSISTSFYNLELCINDVHENVVGQTHSGWGWVITDDFSEDRTKEKLLRVERLDERIKYVEQKKKLKFCHNLHRFSNGDIICISDADNSPLSKTLEVLGHFYLIYSDISVRQVNINIMGQI